MMADELLRRYPRETLRWLRRRLGLSQEAFAEHVGVSPKTVIGWEYRRQSIGTPHLARLVALLAPHLATSEGAAFARSLGRGSEG